MFGTRHLKYWVLGASGSVSGALNLPVDVPDFETEPGIQEFGRLMVSEALFHGHG